MSDTKKFVDFKFAGSTESSDLKNISDSTIQIKPTAFGVILS